MKKKRNKFLIFSLFSLPLLVVSSLFGVAYGGWSTVVVDDNWGIGERYLYNIEFEYANGETFTFEGLEKSSKIAVPLFNDDRYDSEWTIGENSYSGVVNVDTLANASGLLVPVTTNKVHLYTITLTEKRIGLKDGYVEIVVDHAYNVSDDSEISGFTSYSVITEISERFLVFNINASLDSYILDHFVYHKGEADETVYGLNDTLYLSSGGADESKISNKQLVLSAYFKAE